ncbi:hypothetical protein PNV01_11380 [Turicibacter sanguinis]|uniref:hypothetical protein n=1 Tax=Turicibacter sanguinis TaxID=154288 RepID=UPI00232E3B8A|nr:hypothetical protein [Turicibacter sanguinis]MDB8545409.1 hypothetical protein [Turicibacter sanguinis]
MKQDINMDLGLEAFLEPDSDFIEDLCQHLEEEGIHLTNELLVQILSVYEERKYGFFKELIENLVGGENSLLSADGGPAVIQVVMDGKGELKKKESKSKELNDLDSKLLS